MIDPFSTLGAASAIVQLLQFGGNLIGKAYKIHKATEGSLGEFERFDDAISRFKSLAAEVDLVSKDTASGRADPKDKYTYERAKKLAASCTAVAEKLLSVLEELKTPAQPGRLKSMQMAVKIERKRPALAALEQEMNSIRTDVTNFLLYTMNFNQSSLIQTMDTFKRRDRNLGIALSTEAESMYKKLRSLLEAERENRKDPRSVTDGQQIGEKLGSMLSALPLEGRKVLSGQRILATLRYDDMRARRLAVAKSYANTYEWIFDSSTTSNGRSVGFVDWLRNGEGVYWVSGKAGSGKSTLMKLLCESKATKAHLQEWAGDAIIATADHFFWNSGHPLQKSQLGLLRAICFDILRQCPDVMPLVCEERWQSNLNFEYEADAPWSLSELSMVSEQLKNHRLTQNGRQVRFCLFIDGLDEYDGDHRDLIKTIQNMSACPDIKICAASRPWNPFQNAFGGNPERMLTLQDLTHDDIARYVRDNLQLDNHFAHLTNYDGSFGKLITEVTDKAEGVFLWVYLVVRLLLRGLDNGDSLDDLRRRLRALPPDLESYFQHIFETLDDFYQQRTAQTFLVCLEAEARVPLLGFAALEPYDAFAARICDGDTVQLEEVHSMQVLLAKRINARCRDLLEVRKDVQTASPEWPSSVDFLHRTVRDFLLTEHIKKQLHDRAGTKFNPLAVLCEMTLIIVKRLPQLYRSSALRDANAKSTIATLMTYVRRLEGEQQVSPVQTLDALRSLLSNSLSRWAQGILECSKSSIGRNMPRSILFIPFCAREGLVIYLQYLLSHQPNLFTGEVGGLALTTVIENMLSLEASDVLTDRPLDRTQEVVRFLVENGTDIRVRSLRQVYDSSPSMMSFWQWYLQFLRHPTRQKRIPWTPPDKGRKRETNSETATVGTFARMVTADGRLRNTPTLENVNIDMKVFLDITRILLETRPPSNADPPEDEVFEEVFGPHYANDLLEFKISLQPDQGQKYRPSWSPFGWFG